MCMLSHSVVSCSPRDCSPPGSSDHGDSPGKNTGVGCHALLQGIFPTQGLNQSLPALLADSLPYEPLRKPKNTGVGSLSLLQGIFLTQESHWGLLHCGWILYQLSYQESPELGHRRHSEKEYFYPEHSIRVSYYFCCYDSM